MSVNTWAIFPLLQLAQRAEDCIRLELSFFLSWNDSVGRCSASVTLFESKTLTRSVLQMLNWAFPENRREEWADLCRAK